MLARSRYGLVLGLCLYGLALSAQDSSSLYLEPGSLLRGFDSAAMEAYQLDPELDYQENPAELSLWRRFLLWLENVLQWDRGSSQVAWDIIGYILAGLALALLVFQLLKVPLHGIFGRKISEITPQFEEALGEDLNQLDFDSLIAQAVEAKKYRKALRLLYLESLKLLANVELIDWKAHKPNRAYLREVEGTPYEQDFRNLTRTYEFVWYGDFDFPYEQYVQAQTIFSSFRKRLGELNPIR